MSLFYFKTTRIIKNFHKIILYAFLKYFQVYSKGNYKSFEYTGDSEYLKSVEEYIGIKASPSSSWYNINSQNLIIVEKFSFKVILKSIFRLNRLRVIDRHYFGLVGANTLFRLLYNDFTPIGIKEKLLDESLDNLNILKSKIYNETEIFVLGNNEQFSEILTKYEPEYLLTCNSAINNKKIFESKLLVLAFSDPLFHFGINKQAFEYRKKLVEELAGQEGVFIIVPIEGIPLLRKIKINKNLPIIGLDSTYFQKATLRIKNNRILTKNSHNVFTQYLLPISTLNNKTKNIGAVTFNSKNAYEEKLWSHDAKIKKTSNYNFAYEESFFGDRDFKKYYKFHDKQLNTLLKKIKNKRIIHGN
tara:strand:- start:67 stop:1143 length:1077 start_codon:yes stop_codon:yes gene_type:complete